MTTYIERNVGRAGLLLFALMLSTQAAVADERNERKERKERKERSRPWVEGVSEQQQRTAGRLFEDGNKKFADKAYIEALKSYRLALESWDHPGIRFNIAESLAHLDQDEEAYAHVVASLSYGEDGLGPEVHARAVALKAELERKLGRLVISCAEFGAVVTLDGRKLFTGPGETTVWTSPGPHQIVASKRGRVTQNREEIVAAQNRVDLALTLPPLVTSTMMETRWAEWKPWAVVGGGLAVAGLGALFSVRAESRFDAYDTEVSRLCSIDGCDLADLPDHVTSLESRGNALNAAAVVSYSVAGAALVTGVVLLLLNRPRPVEVGVANVSPAVGPGGGGLVVQW
jgi:hypothetical protein